MTASLIASSGRVCDVIRTPRLILALGAGRRAARAIETYLRTKEWPVVLADEPAPAPAPKKKDAAAEEAAAKLCPKCRQPLEGGGEPLRGPARGRRGPRADEPGEEEGLERPVGRPARREVRPGRQPPLVPARRHRRRLRYLVPRMKATRPRHPT